MYTLSKLLTWIIKAYSRLGTVSECVIDLEPQQDSQYTFLETPPKEKRIVLKEDVEETEDSSDFDEKSLVPDTLDCSEKQHRKSVDFLEKHSSVFIQNDFGLFDNS